MRRLFNLFASQNPGEERESDDILREEQNSQEESSEKVEEFPLFI